VSEPSQFKGRPINLWGKYLDVPHEFITDACRVTYENYKRVRAQFPILPDWHEGMTLEEWHRVLHEANPGSYVPPTAPGERTPHYSEKPPLNSAPAVAEWHAYCRAEAALIRDSIRQANESGDPGGAARIRIPSWISSDDWRAA